MHCTICGTPAASRSGYGLSPPTRAGEQSRIRSQGPEFLDRVAFLDCDHCKSTGTKTMHCAITPKFELNFRAPDAPLTGPIKVTIGQCVEGNALVARSEAGNCAIFLDADAERLRQQLHETFLSYQVVEAPTELRSDLSQVVAFVDKSATEGIINLDIGGTAFQQRVWEALCGIPVGQTRTYAEVAQCIGAPEAVRAVAGACAPNMRAIAIPCHRVVHSDERISGYRWGVERKRALLQREQV